MVDSAFIDEVKRRTSIASVIQRYAPLKPSGQRLMGRCPFHQEKTPSFSVNEGQGFFYCFGCNAHGDVIEFLIRMRGLSFMEVIEDLAREAGMAMPKREDGKDYGKERDHRRGLVQINELAAEFYHRVYLQSSLAAAARAYVAKRRLEDLAVAEFRVGYAPDAWQTLVDFLKKKQVDLALAAELGLIKKRESGSDYYDAFRNRLMFPIVDERGDTVGFGGRTLGDDKAKYINSSESAVFKKGRTLYGMHQALPAITREGYAIFVEGYVDLIALWQAGIRNVVAPLGTALTRDHLDLIQRRAGSVVFLFDGDEAGERAAERAVELVLEVGVPARMVKLEDNQDPDEFVIARGADELRRRLGAAQPLVGYFLDRDWVLAPKDAPGIAGWVRQALDTVARLRDPLERGQYLRQISERSNFNEAALRKQIAGRLVEKAADGKAGAAAPPLIARFPNEEVMVVKLLLHYPHMRQAFRDYHMLDKFSDPLLRRAAAILCEALPGEEGAVREVPESLYADEETARHIRRWISEGADETPPSVAERTLQEYLIQIGIRDLDDQVRALRLQASQASDPGAATAATGEVARLKMLRDRILKERNLEILTQVH
jgi:DNA primase